jgi:hypothetical protein
MAIIFLPLLGLQRALLPIILVCSIGLLSCILHLFWEIRGNSKHYGLYFTSFLDVLFITIAVHHLGGIQTWFSWVYAVALIAISSVRGFRIGLYVAVLSSLMNCALMVGEYNGIIPRVTYEFINSPLSYEGKTFLYLRLIGDTVLFMLTAGVSGILSERLTAKGNELERKNIEISAMQEKLQEYASGLENTIAERTEELTTTNRELEKSFSLLSATLESTADGILVADTPIELNLGRKMPLFLLFVRGTTSQILPLRISTPYYTLTSRVRESRNPSGHNYMPICSIQQGEPHQYHRMPSRKFPIDQQKE